MGRRSPDYRDRSPGRRRHGHDYYKDERTKEYGRQESHKVEDLKKHMREQLNSITPSSSRNITNNHELEEDLTPAQRQVRMRQMELIEDGAFKQQKFNSTFGSKNSKKKYQMSRSEKLTAFEDKRDQLLFGPTTKPQEGTKMEKVEQITVPTLTCLPKEASILVHPNFLTDVEIKQKDWKELWENQRRTLGF